MVEKVFVVTTKEEIELKHFVKANNPEEAKSKVKKYQIWSWTSDDDTEIETAQSFPVEHTNFKIVDVQEASYKDLMKQVFVDC